MILESIVPSNQIKVNNHSIYQELKIWTLINNKSVPQGKEKK